MLGIGSVVEIRASFYRNAGISLITRPLIIADINGDQAVVYYIKNTNKYDLPADKDMCLFYDNPDVRACLFQVPLRWLQESGERLQEII